MGKTLNKIIYKFLLKISQNLLSTFLLLYTYVAQTNRTNLIFFAFPN